MEFCNDHSRVMQCLGALEQGQKDIKESLGGINSSLNEALQLVKKRQNGVIVEAAIEKTKSHVLYWVLGVTAGAFIIGIVNIVLKALRIW